MNRMLRSLSVLAALALLLSALGAGRAFADGPVTYDWLAGTDGDVGLCSFDPSACPDIAMAENGDTIELTGSGTVGLHPKSVSGGGTFTHLAADGTVLGEGTWTAEKLLSLHEFGCGGEGLPDDFCGGLMVTRVHLVSDTGLEFDATLWVGCLIGDFPTGAFEGVRLSLHDADLNFNQVVSGFTLLLLQDD